MGCKLLFLIFFYNFLNIYGFNLCVVGGSSGLGREIIYQAIEELKDAMEGMLKPKIEEKVVANVEVRETFKISKVGTVAGCYVLDGTISRSSKIRIIRDGIVSWDGELAALKRFKDDVKEVKFGYECGLSLLNFNDVQVGDVLEAYEEVEVKQTLK